ncbi:hypothetical protein SK128_018664 [Halocaridina rubra]|uniref:Uncharacterized protein n=1 Tax=Halocaridina rubra TaxID=373956 RepID=A0AAN8WNS7_HALRR
MSLYSSWSSRLHPYHRVPSGIPLDSLCIGRPDYSHLELAVTFVRFNPNGT